MTLSSNWKRRLAAMLGCFLVVVFFDFARHFISRRQRDTFEMRSCIWDPLHHLLQPLSRHLERNDFLRKILLAIDSIMIDLAILFFGIAWAIYGRTKSFMPSLMIFYAIRALVLNVCQWPLPKLYLFGYPGIPSYFVDYDQTNDLYFSGHCGCLTVMTTDCYFNGRRRWVGFLFLALAYTFFVLALEGGHYTNDMIIGVIAGFTITRLYFSRKEPITLWYLRVFAKMLTFLQEKFKAIIVLFRLYDFEERKSHGVGNREQSKLEESNL
jgi:hypothetical protein